MQKLEEKILEIFKKKFNREIPYDFNMEKSEEWDSVAQISLILEIEETFNIQFSETDFHKLTSIDNYVKIVDRYLK